jgi:hypothetical protein
MRKTENKAERKMRETTHAFKRGQPEDSGPGKAAIRRKPAVATGGSPAHEAEERLTNKR